MHDVCAKVDKSINCSCCVKTGGTVEEAAEALDEKGTEMQQKAQKDPAGTAGKRPLDP
jgi:hypothetical protein